eukprot:1033489-Alexandrium_andersonii.AAC.1
MSSSLFGSSLGDQCSFLSLAAFEPLMLADALQWRRRDKIHYAIDLDDLPGASFPPRLAPALPG